MNSSGAANSSTAGAGAHRRSLETLEQFCCFGLARDDLKRLGKQRLGPLTVSRFGKEFSSLKQFTNGVILPD